MFVDLQGRQGSQLSDIERFAESLESHAVETDCRRRTMSRVPGDKRRDEFADQHLRIPQDIQPYPEEAKLKP
jgi:hypothetical protein